MNRTTELVLEAIREFPCIREDALKYVDIVKDVAKMNRKTLDRDEIIRESAKMFSEYFKEQVSYRVTSAETIWDVLTGKLLLSLIENPENQNDRQNVNWFDVAYSLYNFPSL